MIIPNDPFEEFLLFILATLNSAGVWSSYFPSGECFYKTSQNSFIELDYEAATHLGALYVTEPKGLVYWLQYLILITRGKQGWCCTRGARKTVSVTGDSLECLLVSASILIHY